jgi:hypothetical protein
MKNYLLEVILITALFTTAMAVPLVQAQEDDAVNNNPQAGVSSDAADVATGNANVLQEGNLRMASGPNGSTIVVKPLDAPDNPYVEQYTDIDRWAYDNWNSGSVTNAQIQAGVENVENRNPVGVAGDGNIRVDNDIEPQEGETISTSGARNRDTRNLRVYVDRDGYVIPQLSDHALALSLRSDQAHLTHSQRIQRETGVVLDERRVRARGDGAEVSISATTDLDGPDGPDVFYYEVPVTDEAAVMLESFEVQRTERLSTALPAVPSWVGDLNPDNFVLLPNGGALVDPMDDTTSYVVYSPEGDEMGRIENPGEWRTFFSTDYPVIAKQAEAQGWDMVEQDGYLLLRDRETRKVEAIYDWDGTPVAVDGRLEPRPYYFTPLRWDGVQQVTQAQKRVPAAGRTPGAQQETGSLHNDDPRPHEK